MRFTDLGLGGRGRVKSNINVTPLIAVLFVLLINLMLFVPPTPDGTGLRLPAAANTVDKPDPRTHEVTVVSVAADRRLFLNSAAVWEEDLAARVTQSLESKRNKTVLFEGDDDAPYSAVMAAMDSLRNAQISDVSLIVRGAR